MEKSHCFNGDDIMKTTPTLKSKTHEAVQRVKTYEKWAKKQGKPSTMAQKRTITARLKTHAVSELM